MQTVVIDYLPYYIEKIDKPPLKLQLKAVRKSGSAVKSIKDPCKEVINAAINTNPSIILDLNGLTDFMLFSAFTLDPKLIKTYDKEISDELKYGLIEHIPSVAKYIDNISEEIVSKVLDNNLVDSDGKPIIFDILPNDISINFLEKYPAFLKHIKEPTDEMIIICLKQDGTLIENVESPTEEMCNIAIDQNGLSIKDIKHLTKKMIMNALEQTGLAIQFIKHPTPNMITVAKKQNPEAEKFIKNKKSFIKDQNSKKLKI